MPTVHEFRNAIRSEVGRFERDVSAPFTKEDLWELANTVGYAVDAGPAAPPTSQIHGGIRWKTGIVEEEEGADGGQFRKDELEQILSTLRTD